MRRSPRLLGAVLAGGAARRFGSDKALALLGDKSLIDVVIDRLRPQVERLVVVGRDHPGTPSIADAPGPRRGPLGGLAAALAHAAANGFDAVLTSGCDLPDLPADLAVRLGPGPAVVAGQPLLGVWPAMLADDLVAYLRSADDFSLWAAAGHFAARSIDLGAVTNINTVAELAVFASGKPVDRSR